MSKLGKSEAEVVSDNSKKQDKFWEDGYGLLWKNIRTPDGIRRVRVQNDHEDVVLEQNEIFRERRTIESFFWLSVLIGFAINLLIIGGIVLGSVAFFSQENYMMTASVVSAAYVCGIVYAMAAKIQARVNRIEIHALTVHYEVLNVKDKLNDIAEKIGK